MSVQKKVKKQVLVLPEILSEEYLQSKEGEYFDVKNYKYVIKSDADVYGLDKSWCRWWRIRP
jgi:hypothetical protein